MYHLLGFMSSSWELLKTKIAAEVLAIIPVIIKVAIWTGMKLKFSEKTIIISGLKEID